MSERVQAQDKTSSTPTAAAPVQSQLQPRSFTAEVEQAPKEQPDLQTQLERAVRFGHNFGDIKVYPSTPPLVQPKLVIGRPGDQYEQEADRVAAQVMAIPDTQQRNQRQLSEPSKSPLASVFTAVAQHHTQQLNEPIQPKSLLPSAIQKTASNNIDQLSQSQGGGSPLSNQVRSFMEPRFGIDLGAVRVHTDATAVQMNRDLHAQAFTHGSNVYFGAGKYNPNSNTGKELLAHELTHVVQQTGGIGRKMVNPQLRQLVGSTETIQRKIGDGHDLTCVRFAGAPDLEACFDGEKLLKVGSSGSAVEKLQQALIDGGFPLPKFGVDGKFGAETKAAIKDFQKSAGFTGPDVDGIVGPKTMAALDARFVGTTPVDPKKPAAVYKSAAEIYGMKLNEFDLYARDQADWATNPSLADEDRNKLRQLLEFARERDTQPVLAGCGIMSVKALTDKGFDPDTVLKPLRTYSQAVKKEVDTVEVQRISDVDLALKFGDALQKLEEFVGGKVIKKIIKQDSNKPQLQQLIEADAILPFILYNIICQPNLHAEEGAEIQSYLGLFKTDNVDPLTYHDQGLSGVRNYHRFEKKALDKLLVNQNNTSKKKPLALILHSAFDHNGAFHRDPNLTEAINHPKHLTLMIEGKESLNEIQGEIPGLAQKYGQDDRIAQVMIAGHGNSRGMELAGTTADGKTATEDSLDLDNNKKATEKFFEQLLAHMASDPNSPARIVLNACLTNSNTVEGPLSDDPAEAKKQIQKAIDEKGSLAHTLDQMAATKGINVDALGANASFGQVSLIDPVTGKFDIRSPDDPKLTASKLEYVSGGTEPGGAMFAVVETWAQDQKACIDAVKQRVNKSKSIAWDETIIRTLYKIVIKNEHNAPLINQLAHAAENLSLAKHESECSVHTLKGADVPDSHLDEIFTALTTADLWKTNYIRLVFNEFWMTKDATKQVQFLAELDKHFDCHSADQFIDVEFIKPDLDQLIPKKAPGSRGQQVLALLIVAKDTANPESHCQEYLVDIVGDSNPKRFPKAMNVDSLLAGMATEQEVLNAIGLGTAAKKDDNNKGQEEPKPNVDLDQDGKNDYFVEPMTKRGKVSLISATVWDRPENFGNLASVVEVLSQDTQVFISGKSLTGTGEFFSIESNHKTAFVRTSEITLN